MAMMFLLDRCIFKDVICRGQDCNPCRKQLELLDYIVSFNLDEIFSSFVELNSNFTAENIYSEFINSVNLNRTKWLKISLRLPLFFVAFF